MFEVLDGLEGQGLADALDANHRAGLGRQAFELLLVAEFATAELAPRLGVSPVSADNLLRDALDLRHRHPLLWARIEATAALAASPVPALTGRRVALVDPGSGELVDPATELGLDA